MEEYLQLVTFRIGDEEFAIPILSVEEIIRMVEITRLPNVPPFVEGVINLRGRVIPVIDLRKRFGLEAKERDERSRILVVTLGDGRDEKTVGLIVDSVSEVLRLPEENLEPISGMGTRVSAEYINGIGKVGERLIILLDVERILSSEEKDLLRRAV